MKTLTSGLTAAINTIKGNEPIIVLAVDWGSSVGTVYYADKSLTTQGGVIAQGRIRKLSDISVVRQNDVFGEVGSCAVELDDYDLHFWQIMNLTNLEGKSVIVYQYFPNEAPTELLVLFVGNIAAPVTWSEGARTLSFSIFTNYNDRSVGNTITSDELLDDIGLVTVLDKNAVGATVPLAFGNCLKTKTLKLFTSRESTTLGNLTFDDVESNIFYYLGLHYIEQDVEVDGGEDWPQGTTVYFSMDTMDFTGIFNGNILTITNHNIPVDLQSARTYRDSTDPDYHNKKVVWIPTTIKLVNRWVWFKDETHGNIINYCTNQNGYKCTFQSDMCKENPDYDDEDSPFVFEMNGSLAIQTALKYSYTWPQVSDFYKYYESYILPVGTNIIALASDTFVANDMPGGTIKQVYAFREVPNQVYNPNIDQYEQRGSLRKLCIVPSSYYIVEDVDYTSVVFERKLSSYSDEFWSDHDIFVTQSSPVGPNTVDIIQWVLENYTGLFIDSVSFASVRSHVDKYPSNFVLTNTKKAIEFCREIAWQARCALRIYNHTAFLVYLSVSPSPVATLVSSKIQYKSLSITYTDTERMYTQAKVKFYRPSLNIRVKDEQLYVFQNNVNVYGLKEVSWDFFIYDEPEYVAKSVDFWLSYYSNSWKKVKVRGFLNSLGLEVFDCILLSSISSTFPVGLESCRAVIEEISYNSENFYIDMVMWLPMLAGTQYELDQFWLSDSSDGISYIDRTDGIVPLDYVVPVGTAQSKKHPKRYAKVTDVKEELDPEGVATGKKVYDVVIYENGPENGTGETFTGLRKIAPDMTDFLVGDILEAQTWANQTYLANGTQDPVAFEFIADFGDYVSATPVDGNDEVVLIAKPFNLRRTPFDGATIGGVTYDYISNSSREADNGVDPVETQMITPDMDEETIIHAVRNVRGLGMNGPDDNPIGWLMIDSYQWAVFDA